MKVEGHGEIDGQMQVEVDEEGVVKIGEKQAQIEHAWLEPEGEQVEG